MAFLIHIFLVETISTWAPGVLQTEFSEPPKLGTPLLDVSHTLHCSNSVVWLKSIGFPFVSLYRNHYRMLVGIGSSGRRFTEDRDDGRWVHDAVQ